jgi:hypothetical protein
MRSEATTADAETTLEAELAAAMHEVESDALLPHAQRGALLLVEAGLGLLPAAIAVATNRTPLVAFWLHAGLLVRATPPLLADVGAAGQRYRFVIVQPYVLAIALRD